MMIRKQRRNTPQRRVILEELCQVVTHPTAAELFAMVRQRLPRISLGTVYRNLEVLHEDGLVSKLEMAGSETRYDGNLEPHLHIRCQECGKIKDVGERPAVAEDLYKRDFAGFEVNGVLMEFFGVCPDCRNLPSH